MPKMPNLFAYGCSHTYGHGLPDCIDKGNTPGPYPSRQGFASHVASDLSKKITFQNDNLPSYEEYLKEVKPFKSK